jgi:hypothetical protein
MMKRIPPKNPWDTSLETQQWIAAHPNKYYWYEDRPWYFRWFLSTWANTDFDWTGNWFSFRGKRYYWKETV